MSPTIKTGVFISSFHSTSFASAKIQSTKAKKTKHTTVGIRWWSPTQLLIHRFGAYLRQSGRDAKFSPIYGRMWQLLEYLVLYMLAISGTRTLDSSNWMKVLAKSMYEHREHSNITKLISVDHSILRSYLRGCESGKTVFCVDVVVRRSVWKSMSLSRSECFCRSRLQIKRRFKTTRGYGKKAMTFYENAKSIHAAIKV